MKKTISISIILLAISLVFISSRTIETELDFLKEVIVKDQDSIIYIRESFGWQKMKEKLNRKKFNDYNNNNSNTIELTDFEYKHILNKIANNENHIWNLNLFSNSQRVSEQEIESYLKIKNEPFNLEVESISNDTSAAVKMKNKNYFAYSFSKPIFFRENKFCIFSYNSITDKNLSNYSQIAFYKNVKGKWIEWLEIYNTLD